MPEVRLALDTASDRLSVAVQVGDGPVAQREIRGARQHAASLLPLAEDALAEIGALPRDIAQVVLADGPGSFTGLRVGAAFAKALTSTGQVTLALTPSLLVRAAGKATGAQRILAMSHAMRGEVFAGVWEFAPGKVTEIVRPRAFTIDALLDLPPAEIVVGEGPDAVWKTLPDVWGARVEQAWPEAKTMLGLLLLSGGTRLVENIEGWEPDYGRPAEAQARWEQEHGRPLPDSPGHPR